MLPERNETFNTKEIQKSSIKGVLPQSKEIKKEKLNYGVYIYKILKQVHPDTEISSGAMTIMSEFINEIFEKIATESAKLSEQNGTCMSSMEVQQSVQSLLSGELAKHAVSEGTRVVVSRDPRFPIKNFSDTTEIFNDN